MLNKCNKCSSPYQTKYSYTLSSYEGNSSTNQRSVSIVLLDDQILELNVDSKCSIDELFKRVCAHLDLKEYDIFGLAQKTKDEYHFVSNDEKLNKLTTNSNPIQPSKRPILNPTSLFNSNTTSNVDLLLNSTIQTLNSSMSSTSSSMLIPSNSIYHQNPASYREFSSYLCNCNLHLNSENSIQFFFRVKFYVNDPLVLSQPKTRYLYYLQLRKNYLNFNIKLNEESYFMYASLALVADFGSFNSSLHIGKYFNINSYFPKWMIDKYGENYIYDNMPRLHIQQSRLAEKNAQIKFCIELSNEQNAFNFNLYRVFKNKEEMPGSICIGIGPKGILVFELRSMQEINLISTFLWQSVAKLNADKKKFEILITPDPKSRQIIIYKYYTSCEKFSKYLLEMCRLTHAFSNNIFSRLADHRALANYVNESYSENVLLAFNNENNCDIYEEREINDKLKANQTNDETTPINKQVIEEVDENEIGNYYENINKNEQQEEEISKKKNEMLSSCSFSSTSSSSYETPLCVNTNDSINFNKNSSDLYSTEQEKFQQENNTLKEKMNSPESTTTSSTSPLNTQQMKDIFISSTSCSSTEENNSNHYCNYEMVNEYNHYSNDSNDISLISHYKSFSPAVSENECANYQQHNPLYHRQTFSSFLPSKTNENSVKLYENYQKLNRLPIPSAHSQTSLTTLQQSDNFISVESIKDHFSRTKSMLHQSLNNQIEQDYSYFMAPYMKYHKKPPSYEESLKKLNESTSLSSISNEDQIEGMNNLNSTTSNYDQNKIFIIEDENYSRPRLEINTTLVNDTLSVNKKQNGKLDDDNEILLSVESLEQIRKRAASMSLPMLTALCSDQSLIRCLKQQ